MPRANPLRLLASLAPAALERDAIVDVRWALTLENVGAAPITVHPKAALLAVGGWGGPSWFIEENAAPSHRAALRPIEIRSWYGPPGIPPTASYFQPSRVTLAPGDRVASSLDGCWVPRSRIPDASLTSNVLDPDGMDGSRTLADVGSSSVLVFGQGREHVEEQMRKRVDFLRPSQALFLPGAGRYTFTVSYVQGTWEEPDVVDADRLAASTSVPLLVLG